MKIFVVAVVALVLAGCPEKPGVQYVHGLQYNATTCGLELCWTEGGVEACRSCEAMSNGAFGTSGVFADGSGPKSCDAGELAEYVADTTPSGQCSTPDVVEDSSGDLHQVDVMVDASSDILDVQDAADDEVHWDSAGDTPDADAVEAETDAGAQDVSPELPGCAEDCSLLDTECATGSCIIGGVCASVPKDNGTICDDSNSCTTSDACQAGQCTGDEIICEAAIACNVPGVCDPSTGQCSVVLQQDGVGCFNGSACTCLAGSCEKNYAVLEEGPAIGNATNAQAVTVADGKLLVADGPNGLRVFDTAGAELGHVELLGYARAIAVDGQYAYVAATSGGLRVVDLNTYAEVGSVVRPDAVYDVAIQGNYALCSEKYNGLLVVDITDPTSPAVVVTNVGAPSSFPFNLDVNAGLAYLAFGTDGVQIVNVFDPTAPFEMAIATTTGPAKDVQRVGTTAYVVGSGGLWLVNVQVATDPAELGGLDTVAPTSLHVVDGLAFIAGPGLDVVDVSNPAMLVSLGSLTTTGTVVDVFTDGTTAYLAEGAEGVRAVALGCE